jgi:hypothetical protein
MEGIIKKLMKLEEEESNTTTFILEIIVGNLFVFGVFIGSIGLQKVTAFILAIMILDEIRGLRKAVIRKPISEKKEE